MSLGLLPFDLLEPILGYLEGTRPPALRVCCLVNHDFNEVAARLLYRRITIYHWYKCEVIYNDIYLYSTNLTPRNPKQKVAALLITLAESPRLASFVHVLELTDFPKGISPELESTQDSVIPALKNCVNLTSCRWTRDGTLSNEILETLQGPDRVSLRTLEINANSRSFYDASKLLGFTNLTRLVLILPDGETVARLPVWCEKIGATLTDLSIIRKSGSLVTDALLRRMGEHLVNLTHFSIINCSYVTQDSILFLLRASIPGIRSLYLGPLSPQFDWIQFVATVRMEGLFRELSRLTLSKPAGPDSWSHLNLSSLIESTPLQTLDLYDDGIADASLPTRKKTLQQFFIMKEHLRTIMKTHGQQLRVLSLLRMEVNSEFLEEICIGFPHLKKLFFSYVIAEDPWPVNSLSPLMALRQLEYFHVNTMRLHSGATKDIFPAWDQVVRLIETCSPHLVQCGFDSKVWQIKRMFERLPEGAWKRTIALGPYDRVEVPEQFLVVRT